MKGASMTSALLHQALLEVKREDDPLTRECALRKLLLEAGIDPATVEDTNAAIGKLECAVRSRRATELGFVYLGR